MAGHPTKEALAAGQARPGSSPCHRQRRVTTRQRGRGDAIHPWPRQPAAARWGQVVAGRLLGVGERTSPVSVTWQG